MEAMFKLTYDVISDTRPNNNIHSKFECGLKCAHEVS